MTQVSLRHARADDANLVFGWRNLPEIVRLSLSGRTVGWSEHRVWFDQALEESGRLLLIVEVDGEACGQVRFDWVDDETCEVSIYLLSEWTGRGLGVQALRQGCAEAFTVGQTKRILARVKADNLPSLGAFRRAGFVAAPSDAETARDVVLMWLLHDAEVPIAAPPPRRQRRLP